jgi:Ca2+-binding RTX toxin-like protein
LFGNNSVGTGNSLNNVIRGSVSNDTLNGGLGNDTLDGQGGAANDLHGGKGTIPISQAHSSAPSTVSSRMRMKA